MTILKTLALIGAMVLGGLEAGAQQCEVVAHRGYWKAEGSAQNSIRALVKADSIACWGSEFDVWSDAQGQLWVNHDDKYNGIELQTAPSSVLAQQRLPNGEKLPTLDEYLTACEGVATNVVLELKEHRSMRQEDQAVRDILLMVKEHGLQDRITYITFSVNALLQFIKEAPAGTPVYYLEGDLKPSTLKGLGSAGLDYSLGTMRAHPEWFAKAHELGLKVNVWTVNKADDMRWCLEQGADFITTNEPELLQSILAEKR